MKVYLVLLACAASFLFGMNIAADVGWHGNNGTHLLVLILVLSLWVCILRETRKEKKP